MDTRRWLLPFTHGVDMQALDAVVSLTQGSGITLVAVSLVSAPDKPGSRGVRLEHIQQSKDFLEAVKWKAARLGGSLEQHEVFTVDVMQSLTMLTRELHCDAMVLVSHSQREVLLHAHQFKRLLEKPPASLLVLRLSTQTERQPAGRLSARVLAWLRRRLEDLRSGWNAPELEELLWIRTEEYH